MALRTVFACALLDTALAGLLTAQGQVHVVDPGTPGAFATIQAAVDAAASGDTVLVRPAPQPYGDFAIGRKSVTIVGDSAGMVAVGSIGVFQLSASHAVVLRNLESPVGAFDLQSNDGLVWIEGCRRPGTAFSYDGPALVAFDCPRVVVVRSTLQGEDFEGTLEYTDPAVWLTGGSTLHAYDSSFRGAEGGCEGAFGLYDCWASGAAVLTEPGSSAFLTGCWVHGGDARVWDAIARVCVPAGRGIVANGPVHVRDSTVEGGSGATCALPGAPYSGAVQFLAGESLSLSTGPLAREGADLVFAFRGAPHAEVWLIGSPFARVAARPAQHGYLLLGLPRALEYMGRMDASGALDVPVPIGNLAPTWEVRRTFLQPLMIEGARSVGGHARERASRVTLGAGSAFLVLDQSF